MNRAGRQSDWIDVDPPPGVVKARVNTKSGVVEMEMEKPLRCVTVTIDVPEGVDADLFAADIQEELERLRAEP